MSDASARLSPRHRDCLRGVAALKSSKEIAADLGISAKTVDGYLAEAKAILRAVDRRDAARLFVSGDPERLPPETIRVEPSLSGDPETRAQSDQLGNGPRKGLSQLSMSSRAGLIMVASLALLIGIGVAVVAVVGLVSIYESSRTL